jgi:hypothetical protein
MIYLTFDTNIWIYSLDESWVTENKLDYLEDWIRNGDVKLLLPQIVIDEWNKHEAEEVEKRQKVLKVFFEMAEEILPSAFFNEYKAPSVQKKIIEEQLLRIRSIIKGSEIIPNYPEVLERVINDGISKKAPLHKKSSIADAIIVFSLIQYAKNNPEHDFHFISGNTEDFTQKINNTKDIHPDLKNDFNNFNISYHQKLNQLIVHLRNTKKLQTSRDINQIRRERIQNKLREKVYNPEYDNLIEVGTVSYIKNINTIDFILKEDKPTKEQVIFVLALADSDTKYEQYFYEKITSTIWLEILVKKDVFNPKNNPEPSNNQSSFWHPLLYLHRLSKSNSDGEVIDSIISIINNISKKQSGNIITWNYIIRILNNIPNEKIPILTLDFIPIWLGSTPEDILQTSEICQNLLPKFLSDYPTKNDIIKADIILKHLFFLKKKNIKEKDYHIFSSYYSNIDINILTEALTEKDLIAKIAIYCSSDILILLAENIRNLYFDFPNGINITIEDIEKSKYNIKANFENNNITIGISKESDQEEEIKEYIIKNLEELTIEQIKKIIVEFLLGNNILLEENDTNFEVLFHALKNGSYYVNNIRRISQLSTLDIHRDSFDISFVLILRGLLDEKIKQQTEESIQLLKLFMYDKKYKLSIFRRILIYIISNNWPITQGLFWEIVKDDDKDGLFSDYAFNEELYEMLYKNQNSFSSSEIKTLQRIIDIGPQSRVEDIKDSKSTDYWKFRWYSALRNINPFKEEYEKFSSTENITSEHFEKERVVRIRRGSVSPINLEELSQKSNEEIVEFIRQFNPKSRWEDENFNGLADALSKAIEENPQKFSKDIEHFKDIYYLYAYNFANGFKVAWENKREFNWEKVLFFFKEYISSEKFETLSLNLPNDEWDSSPELVIGAIGNLLSAGMRSDKNAFDLSLLPIVKDIFKVIIPNFREVDNNHKNKFGSPNYVINSTSGKMLSSVLEYSLRRARNLVDSKQPIKWEEEIKIMFDQTFKNHIIDGYILLGWHFRQFYYLDKKWSTKKIEEFYNIDEKKWISFFEGLVFSNPPTNKRTYRLFFPHYERAIKNNIQIEHMNENGLIRHIACFYLWGFETLIPDSLTLMLLQQENHSNVVKFIHFIGRQEDYLKDLDVEETSIFINIIYDLWRYISERFENATNDKEKEIMGELSNLLVFISELNQENVQLITKTCKYIKRFYEVHKLFENLIRLKEKGKPDENARYISEILKSLPDEIFSLLYTESLINEILIFLYENNQKYIADDVCNIIVKGGNNKLIALYNTYNKS